MLKNSLKRNLNNTAVKLLSAFALCILAWPVSQLAAIQKTPADIISESDQSRLRIQAGVTVAGLNGIINEFAYQNNQKISELNWDLMPLFLAGCNIKLLFFNRLSLNIGYYSGISAKSGMVDDTDWANNIQTHYSNHNARLERAEIFDVNIGFSFFPAGNLFLTPFAGFSAYEFKVSAQDGYLLYPPAYVKTDVYGTQMDYRQTYYIPYAGLSLQWNYNTVSVALSVTYTPFALCYALDNHFKRSLVFYDTAFFVHFVSAELDLRYRLKHGLSLIFSVAYETVPEQKSDTFSINTSTGARSSTINEGAGMSYSSVAVSLSAVVNISLF